MKPKSKATATHEWLMAVLIWGAVCVKIKIKVVFSFLIEIYGIYMGIYLNPLSVDAFIV